MEHPDQNKKDLPETSLSQESRNPSLSEIRAALQERFIQVNQKLVELKEESDKWVLQQKISGKGIF
ncbi:hypothetical protein [Pedobacter nutrimenti]|uniref:Uncharacterized protein n=1 Tax=Pedobacter nutrimenti TaxID=1241337 RepID=A0A318UDZ7_9SPHI|nr:hypothetical protein [Pedobacter nutrimenti]PYF74303.1 hypothetical protein B0O44_104474 [Pedobacter nutrimenti]